MYWVYALCLYIASITPVGLDFVQTFKSSRFVLVPIIVYSSLYLVEYVTIDIIYLYGFLGPKLSHGSAVMLLFSDNSQFIIPNSYHNIIYSTHKISSSFRPWKIYSRKGWSRPLEYLTFPSPRLSACYRLPR